MFYYEQFFRTAIDGIDRSNIMPTTILISQVILLISFLVAVYESYIRGGDVRMLGIAGVKYVALGLVLSAYATIFRDVNTMFNAFSDFIAASTTGGDVFKSGCRISGTTAENMDLQELGTCSWAESRQL